MKHEVTMPQLFDPGSINGRKFLRSLRWLIFYAWNIPPIFGLGFILLIRELTTEQLIGILTTPLEPAYILFWAVFSVWFLPRLMRPLANWLDGIPGCTPAAAQRSVRRFPLAFWAAFLIYLFAAPASVIIAAERYTDFVATPYDWFRIELVALIVSIIVGLPIFFLIFDLFGRAMGSMKLRRPIFRIRTKVFLIGALVPLLIDTMLVQYYWTRTGYFNLETFGVWLVLELIAIAGSLIFAHSFAQSLMPLQTLIDVTHPLPESRIAALHASSTDEIGVLTADYRVLLEKQRLQGEMLELTNRLLRSAGGDVGTAAVFQQVVELCRQVANAAQAFVLVYDQMADELVGVIQTGSDYRPEGHYRLMLDETSLAVWVFKNRKAAAILDCRVDERVSQRMRSHFDIRSAIAVPMLLDDKVMGVLMAVAHNEPQAYSNRDIVFVEGLAREAAYALNAQMLREARFLAEKSYLEQQELFGLLLNSTAEGIYGIDMQGICNFVNPACLHMLGYERPEDLIGKPIHTLIHHTYPDGRNYQVEECKVHLATSKGKSAHCEDEVLWRSDGSSFPVEYWSHPIYRNAEVAGAVVTFVDITSRKQSEAELRIAATAFNSQESMMITDANGVILRVNKAFTDTTGYSTEELVGQTPSMLKSGRHDANFYREMWESIARTGTWQGEIWDRRKNGEVYPKWLTISAVKRDDGMVTHYVGSHFDITERKAVEEKVHHLAFYDPLTDLPNRRMLFDRLQHALVSSARTGRQGALLIIDLDNFKALNDTLGHDFGDALLTQVAQRLEPCVRTGDTVARLGGDEFVVVLENLSARAVEAATQVETIGEKILAAINQLYKLGPADPEISGRWWHSTTSIGATLFIGHQTSLEELMKQADIAMYQAKKAGRNTLRFFDPLMQEAINERVSLESELRKALELQQFQLHYQIQVDSSGRPLGAEALIRWDHPERGMISPALFIPLAEETGLIQPIGQWVLETACAQLKAWQKEPGTRDLVLAVNVSAKQFHQVDFVTQVRAIIRRLAINPMRLKLELTESLLLSNIEDTIATMSAMKETGIQFSMDDFGTGYSSLQYLMRLPLDQLKIDISFVRGLGIVKGSNSIVQTIIAMAHSLKLDVIAEGVETEEQREILSFYGCQHYQGYLFSKPVPIEQFEALLRQG
jgi:diguanylate cyclase (GGDEF)-like protein/PAS domain S-box-containing protein